MSDYEIGYGKPPKHMQFGQPGAPLPGVTSEMRKMQIENAEKATRIRQLLLDAVLAKAGGMAPEETAAMIDAAMNTLIKDSENRGLGMPTQQVDNTSSDGSQAPTKIVVQGVSVKKDEE